MSANQKPGVTAGGNTKLRRVLFALLLFLAAAVGLYVATRGGGNSGGGPVALSGQPAALEALAKGQVAAFMAKQEAPLPDITFNDGDAQSLKLSDWKGKVVLLNLWATWCVPCRKEMPMLDAVQKLKGGKDFAVIALNMDRGSTDKAKTFLSETKATNLALYHDPTGKLGSTIGIVGLPTTLLIGRDGRELGRLVGPAEWDSAEAIALIEQAMK